MNVKPKTILVVCVVTLLCGIAIAFAMMKLKAPVSETTSVVDTTETREEPNAITVPQVTFSFSPTDSLNVSVNENKELGVYVETAAELNGVDLYIEVDDGAFAVTGARAGDFFTDALEYSALKEVSEGLYVYSLGSLGKPASGTGIVAVFTLTALNSSLSASVGVNSKTIASVKGGGMTSIILPIPLQYSIVEKIQ